MSGSYFAGEELRGKKLLPRPNGFSQLEGEGRLTEKVFEIT